MQRTLNASAIVGAKLADARDYVREIFRRYLARHERQFSSRKPRLWGPTEVHDNLEKVLKAVNAAEILVYVWGQSPKEGIEIIGRRLRHLHHLTTCAEATLPAR
jgi:hypothetical protein